MGKQRGTATAERPRGLFKSLWVYISLEGLGGAVIAVIVAHHDGWGRLPLALLGACSAVFVVGGAVLYYLDKTKAPTTIQVLARTSIVVLGLIFGALAYATDVPPQAAVATPGEPPQPGITIRGARIEGQYPCIVGAADGANIGSLDVEDNKGRPGSALCLGKHTTLKNGRVRGNDTTGH